MRMVSIHVRESEMGLGVEVVVVMVMGFGGVVLGVVGGCWIWREENVCRGLERGESRAE